MKSLADDWLPAAQTGKTMKSVLFILAFWTAVALEGAGAQELPARRTDTLRLPALPSGMASSAAVPPWREPAPAPERMFGIEERDKTPVSVLQPIPRWVVSDRFYLNPDFLLFESGVMISNGQAQHWDPAWWRGLPPYPGAYRDARTLSMPIPR